MVRRSAQATSVVLACAAAISAVAGTASAARASATATAACSTSSQTVDIAALAFNPQYVAPGQSSIATATIVNCTGQTQTAAAEWLGHWVGAGTGIPAGCPAIDPLLLSVTLPPHGAASSSVGYLVPGSCTASGLVMTVDLLQGGRVVAQRSTELAIEQPLAPGMLP